MISYFSENARSDYSYRDLLSERLAVCLLSPHNSLIQASQLACYTLLQLLRFNIGEFINDSTSKTLVIIKRKILFIKLTYLLFLHLFSNNIEN